MAATSADEARTALRAAVRQQSERGLRLSAKWAAEQLSGLPPEAATADREMGEVGSHSATPMSQDEPPPLPGAAPAPAEGEEDAVLLAKSYYDVNEFRRAAHVLRGARGGCGRFLRW
jgi:anaphase-promoting complex subunit 8